MTDFLHVYWDVDDRKFYQADDEWFKDNELEGHLRYPLFPAIRGHRCVADAYMQPVHWQRLVLNHTEGRLQHLLLVICLYWGGLKERGYYEAYPSQKTMAHVLGCHRSTVTRYLEDACGLGWLVREKRCKQNSGQIPNNYILALPERVIGCDIYELAEHRDRISPSRQERIERYRCAARSAGGDSQRDEGYGTERHTPSLNDAGTYTTETNSEKVHQATWVDAQKSEESFQEVLS